MRSIRVLLIDDNPLFLATVRGFLSAQPGIEIAGTALSGLEAVSLVESVKPDLCMPDMDGLEATRRIKNIAGAQRVIIVSMNNGAIFRAAAAGHGADGYVTKAELPIKLLPLVRGLLT